MYKIDTVTASVSLPTPAALGTEGYWTKGNPGSGVPATQMDQDWFNALQGNLIAVVDGAGIAHSKSDYTVLRRAIQSLASAHGQCRLQYGSATSLALMPLNGNKIQINGAQYAVPSAGVTIANTGLTASTKYYVYAWNNAGALALELSTTGHSTDTTAGNVGVEIKTGDSSRSLVGMIYTDGSTPGKFQSGALTLSWFNRRNIVASANPIGTTTSLTFVELDSAHRVPFLTWSDEQVLCQETGGMSNGTSGDGARCNIGFDGTSPTGGDSIIISTTGGQTFTAATWAVESGSEGFHYATTIAAAVTGGTATFNITLNAIIRG